MSTFERQPQTRPSRLLESQLATMDPRFGPLLDSLTVAFQSLNRVDVVAVVGSTADGIADRYSDLDLQCGVRGETSSGAAAVREAVFSVMDVGDYRWPVPSRILSVVSTSWLRVDVTVIALQDPHDRFAYNAIDVVNRTGRELKRAAAPALHLEPAELTAQVTRFLRSLGLVVRDLYRGDLRLCCFAVEFLVDELVTLMYQARGLQRGGQKGAYSQLGDDDVRVLQSLPVAEPTKHSIVKAHVAVAEEYLARAHELCGRRGADWPSGMVEATRIFLREELDTELRSI